MKTTQKRNWSRYWLPIALALVALGFYAFSIWWVIQSRGGA